DQVQKATKNNSATTKGTQGKDSPSSSTSSGQVSVAGAVAINLEYANSTAFIDNSHTITATGLLSVKSSANVDGAAIADASAVINVIEFDPTTKVNTTTETIDLGASSGIKNSAKVTYTHGQDGT